MHGIQAVILLLQHGILPEHGASVRKAEPKDAETAS